MNTNTVLVCVSCNLTSKDAYMKKCKSGGWHRYVRFTPRQLLLREETAKYGKAV